MITTGAEEGSGVGGAGRRQVNDTQTTTSSSPAREATLRGGEAAAAGGSAPTIGSGDGMVAGAALGASAAPPGPAVRPTRKHPHQLPSLHEISWSCDSRLLLGAVKDFSIRVWDAHTGIARHAPLRSHTAEPWVLEGHPSNPFCAMSCG